VYLISLTNAGDRAVLSSEEAARAARFVFDRDRAHFIAAHSALRSILAGYLGEPANALEIGVADKGKPFLSAHPGLRFNLSHSGEYAMVAVAEGREVGVDIERMRGERPTRDIAERFFAPYEVAALAAEPVDRQIAVFFAIWSRKEAYIKARGEGLGIALDSFVVSHGPEGALLEAEDRERWSMYSLAAPEGYAAALCVEGAGARVRQIAWPSRRDT